MPFSYSLSNAKISVSEVKNIDIVPKKTYWSSSTRFFWTVSQDVWKYRL